MKNCPVFVSSADSYSDLWPIFFDLFKKYWPEYNGTIYLNTEIKEFSYDGLDIKCTKVGKFNTFGKTFRAGLAQVDDPYVLLIMIDYFFMGRVNNTDISDYFNYFKKHDLDSLCLYPNKYRETVSTDYKNLYIVSPPSKDNVLLSNCIMEDSHFK